MTESEENKSIHRPDLSGSVGPGEQLPSLPPLPPPPASYGFGWGRPLLLKVILTKFA